MTDAAPRCRLLLVEPDASVRRVVTRALSGTFEVTALENQASALQRVKEQPFDVALIELTAPDGAGLELIAILQQKGVATIATSASADPTAVSSALPSKAVTFLAKPFDAATLKKHLERARARST